jgi:hypothetical protein
MDILHKYKLNGLFITARNPEATHRLAQLVIIPIIRSNSDLVAAGAIAVDAKNTVRSPVCFPIDRGAGLAGGLGAALVLLVGVPLSSAGGENPSVGHWEDGDEGSEGGCGELHCFVVEVHGRLWVEKADED